MHTFFLLLVQVDVSLGKSHILEEYLSVLYIKLCMIVDIFMDFLYDYICLSINSKRLSCLMWYLLHITSGFEKEKCSSGKGFSGLSV